MGDHDTEAVSKRVDEYDSSRRGFLQILGAAAVGGVGTTGTASAQETPVISIGNTYFDPIGLHVEPGTTVRFEIEAGSHSATAYEVRIPSDSTPFDSGVISTGGFEHTFDTPGTYDYYCIPHKSMGMVGRIVVGEPGGPAENDPIPDGEVPDSETIVNQGPVTIDEFETSGGNARRGMIGAGRSGGMTGAGQGMVNGFGPGWMMLMPIGFLTAVGGVVGGVAYWASRRGNTGTTRDTSAMATLRDRYARGEIDEEQYAERRRQLDRKDEYGE